MVAFMIIKKLLKKMDPCSYKNNTLKISHSQSYEFFTRKVCEMFVYKHTKTIKYVKK